MELDRSLSALSMAIVAAGAENDVVVAVVDNFSDDHTRDIVDSHVSKAAWVRYFHHNELRRTAEESLFHALAFADTDYVWTLGDDDVVTDNFLRLLLPVLREGRVDFVLLNLISKTPEAEHGYYRFPYPSVFYEHGLDLFRDFGLISATTTISCLCFKKTRIQKVDWLRLQNISPIYSHSCALLIAFGDAPVLALGEPTVVYTQNMLAVEHRRISQLAHEGQRPTYHAFTIGLIHLLQEVERETALSLAELVKLEEMELSKSDRVVKHSLTGHFVAFHVIGQLLLGLDSGEKNERFSENDIRTIRQFLEGSSDVGLQRIIEKALEAAHRGERSMLEGCQRQVLQQETEYFERRVNPDPDRSHAVILFDHQRPFKWSRGRPADAAGANLVPHDVAKRLTILIPTFNRARNLARQLRILKQLPVGKRRDVEILVAENACTDRSTQVLRAAQKVIPTLRALHFDVHVSSAEENIDRTVHFARGDYVWLLGDDDEPIAPTVALLLHLLDYTEPDCLVFNSSVHNGKVDPDTGNHESRAQERALPPGIMPLGAALSEHRYADLLQEFGIMTSMAFISRHVFRRPHYVSYDDLIRVSRIYSHVYGLARTLHGRQTVAVNYTLIARRDSPVLERFRDIAKQAGTWFAYPWVLGLVRLGRRAEDDGWLPRGHLQSVCELGPGGRRFELVDEVFMQLVRQFMLCLETGSREQLPTRAEVVEFLEYFDDLPKRIERDEFLAIHTRIDEWLRQFDDAHPTCRRWLAAYGQKRRGNRLRRDLRLISERIPMRNDRFASRPIAAWLSQRYIRAASRIKRNEIIGPIATRLID